MLKRLALLLLFALACAAVCGSEPLVRPWPRQQVIPGRCITTDDGDQADALQPYDDVDFCA